MTSLSRRAAAGLLLAPLVAPSLAIRASAEDRPATPAPGAARPPELPTEVVTRHQIGTGADALSFRARAGAVRLVNAATDATVAELAYVAYETDAPDPTARPIVFAINGGPGAASAFLNLGAIGPWRLRMDGPALAPSAEPRLVENAETWLPFADLVMIDTPGTGFSRAREPAAGQTDLYSVDGDVEALAAFIRKWLTTHGRLASPKYILAESYGGIRAPRLADKLAQRDNVGIRGLFLVSPLLNVTMVEGDSPLLEVARLPSFAAVNRGARSRADLADVEAYARSDYLVDLLRGPRDAAAQTRIANHLSAMAGVSEQYVRTAGGRIERNAFLREPRRSTGRVRSNYDGTITGWDPAPNDYYSIWADPMLDVLRAPIGAAMTTLVRDKLQWPVADLRYEVLNYSVGRRWDWGKPGRLAVESMTAMRACLAGDPNFRVAIVHGLYDLVTTYFATQLLMDALPAYGPTPRVSLTTYAAGHMLYSSDDGRKGMRDEGRALIAAPVR